MDVSQQLCLVCKVLGSQPNLSLGTYPISSKKISSGQNELEPSAGDKFTLCLHKLFGNERFISSSDYSLSDPRRTLLMGSGRRFPSLCFQHTTLDPILTFYTLFYLSTLLYLEEVLRSFIREVGIVSSCGCNSAVRGTLRGLGGTRGPQSFSTKQVH